MNLMFMLIIFIFLCMIFKGVETEPFEYDSVHNRYYMMVIVSFFSMLVNKYLLYFTLFEITLILLTLVMMKCSSQFDRNTSVNFLYLYSILSGISFMMFLSLESTYDSTIMNMLSKQSSSLVPMMTTFFIILIGLVKSPMYSLHHWLPKVHVESPMMNSMILSSFMLKLGTLLLIYMMNYFVMYSNILMLIILMLTAVSSLLMLRQTDFKLFVAYSSVMHMTFSLVSLFFSNLDSYMSLMIMSFMHSIISPLMFSVVYFCYSFTNERSVTAAMNFWGTNSMTSYMMMAMLLFNMSFPVFGSFLSEMLIIGMISMMSDIFMMAIFVFVFLMSSVMTFILIIKLVKFNNYSPCQSSISSFIVVINMLMMSLFYLYMYTYL